MNSGIASLVKPKEKIVNGNKSIDKEEEDACMTIEDERTEASLPSVIRNLEVELGEHTKAASVRNSKTVQRRMPILRQSMPTFQLKKSDTKPEDNLVFKEEVISTSNIADCKGEQYDGSNTCRNSNDGALRKLDLLKKKQKK